MSVLQDNASEVFIEGTHNFVVSRWVIPNGSDYNHAFPINLFFEKEEDATTYQKKYEMPPEMASLTSAAKWRNTRDQILANRKIRRRG